MKDKISITLQFNNVVSFEFNEEDVSIKYKTEDGGTVWQTFPKKDVKSFYNYSDEE